MTSPLAASNAYAAVSKIASGAGMGDAAPAAKGGGFGDMLKEVVSNFAEQGKQADAKALEAVSGSGKGDVVDVVTSIAESELALNTLVSVRDKVIAAYEEIMRMPI